MNGSRWGSRALYHAVTFTSVFLVLARPAPSPAAGPASAHEADGPPLPVRIWCDGVLLDDAPYELGELPRGRLARREFLIENTADHPLALAASSCCGKFVLLEKKFTIPPRGSHQWTFQVRADRLRGTHLHPIDLAATESHEGSRRLLVAFSVPAEWELDPVGPLRLFWSPETPAPGTETVLTVSEGFSPSLDGISAPGYLRVTPEPVNATAGSWRLKIRLDAEAAPGEFRAIVRVPIRGADPPFHEAQIDIEGEGMRRFAIEPDAVFLKGKGQSIDTRIEVRPFVNAPRKVRLRWSDRYVHLRGTHRQEDGSIVLDLRIEPPTPGVWNLFPELEITGENGGVETVVLPISVRLRGQ